MPFSTLIQIYVTGLDISSFQVTSIKSKLFFFNMLGSGLNSRIANVELFDKVCLFMDSSR